MNLKTNILLIITVLVLTACGGGDPTYITPSAEPDTPVAVEPPEVIEQPHILAIYDSTTGEFGTSDGETISPFGTYQTVSNGRDGFISLDDVLHGIDDTGESIISDRLPCVADAVAIGADTWTFEIIDPATAQSLGALPKYYTRIYQNADEYGLWYLNQWQVADAFVTESGDIIALDTAGHLHDVVNDLTVNNASHNGLLIHDQDIPTLRSHIKDATGDYRVAYNTNYFLSADEWLNADGVWYSWNGYKWDGVLTEYATALQGFIQGVADSPVVIAAGTRIEHGETVTYWIECNTGLLYRYTPSVNLLEIDIMLYQGSGLRQDGIVYAANLKPVMTDNFLFYADGGTVWKYDFSTVSAFASSVEFWRM